METRLELDAEALRDEIAALLAGERHCVLATAAGDRVTARTMSYIVEGLIVWMQTDRRFVKVDQLAANPKAALCLGNLQAEGTIAFAGHPQAPGNEAFASAYAVRHPSSWARYGALEDEVVLRFEPTDFTLWKYIDGQPCRDRLMVGGQVTREYYR